MIRRGFPTDIVEYTLKCKQKIAPIFDNRRKLSESSMGRGGGNHPLRGQKDQTQTIGQKCGQ